MWWLKRSDGFVAVAQGWGGVGGGLAHHFDAFVDEIDDPVILDAGTGIEAGFSLAIETEGGVGHFQDEQRRARVAGADVVTDGAGDDGNVGFGVGVETQDEGHLRAHQEIGEGLLKGLLGQKNSCGVCVFELRHVKNLSVDQFNALGIEESPVGHLIIFSTGEAMESGLGCLFSEG